MELCLTITLPRAILVLAAKSLDRFQRDAKSSPPPLRKSENSWEKCRVGAICLSNIFI
jgi:hypothetical protein